MLKKYTINIIKDKKIIANIFFNEQIEAYRIIKIIKEIIDYYNNFIYETRKNNILDIIDTFSKAELLDLDNKRYYVTLRKSSKEYIERNFGYILDENYSGCFAFIGINNDDISTNSKCGTNILIDCDQMKIIGDFFVSMTVREFEIKRNYEENSIIVNNFPLCPINVHDINFIDLFDMVEFIKKDQNYYFRNEDDELNIFVIPKNIKQHDQ